MLLEYNDNNNNNNLTQGFDQLLSSFVKNDSVIKFSVNIVNGIKRIVIIRDVLINNQVQRHYYKSYLSPVGRHDSQFFINNIFSRETRNKEICRLYFQEHLVQVELADIFGLSQSTISTIVNSNN